MQSSDSKVNVKLGNLWIYDNISAEHLVYGGPTLYIHMCLLFNAMMRHCYVPQDFGLIMHVPWPKDKHGDIRLSLIHI